MIGRLARAASAAWSELRAKAIPPIPVSSPYAVSLFGTNYDTAAGVDVTEDTAMRFAAVYSCVSVLSKSIAQLPLILYRRSGRDRSVRERAYDHPLYRILHDNPNHNTTSYQWRQMLVAQLALNGNSVGQIIRNRALDVVGIRQWPVDQVVIEQIDGWQLRYRFFARDREVVLPEVEVLHLRGLSLDGLVGLSPIAACRESVGEGIAASKSAAAYMRNGLLSPAFLEHPGRLSDNARANLKDSFSKEHGGWQNSGKVPILEEGMQLKSLGLSMADAQFLESRKFNRSEIAGIFGVPAHMINDLDRATFSNIEHQDIGFVKHTLGPWLRNIEQQLELSLLTEIERGEYFIEFSVDGLLRGDNASRWDSYTSAIQWGVLSPNEVRELENRNPREGGDDYLTPINMAVGGRIIGGDGGGGGDNTDGENE